MRVRERGGTLLDAEELKKGPTHKLKQNSLAVGGFVLVARFSSCAFVFLFLMFSDPIAVAIWPHRLSRATHWAGGSVANADVPLPHELTAALALRGHMEVSKPREREEPQESALCGCTRQSVLVQECMKHELTLQPTFK